MGKLEYIRAKARVKELREFYIALSGYALFVPFWIFLNFKTTPDFHWFWFPTIGGAIGMSVFAFSIFAGRKWEEKKIHEIMEKEKQNFQGNEQ